MDPDTLLNTVLFEQKFARDPLRPEWLKINKIAIGEKVEYSYKNGIEKNIGKLLDMVYEDEKVSVCVYKVSTGEYFTKTGFNIGDPADYRFSKDFNSFVALRTGGEVPTPVPSPTPVPYLTRSLVNLLGNKRPYGAYLGSWSCKWTSSAKDSDLANIKNANIVYISFAFPDCKYKLGQNSWDGTGLLFSSDFAVIKEAIKILKSKGVVVMLSIGGASYPFSRNFNADGAANLVKDLGLHGIDIDWENHSEKESFGKYIAETRRALGDNYAVSTAAFSVGAYGEGKFANQPPSGDHTGMNLAGLKSNGKQLDWINIMTYDASDVFDPTMAYNAYRSYYAGPLMIGGEVPPEAWGGHVLNLDKVKNILRHLMEFLFGLMIKKVPRHAMIF